MPQFRFKGQVYNFPDDVSEEEALAFIDNLDRGMFGREEPAPFTPREVTLGDRARRVGDEVQRKAGVVASGAAQGISNLVGLPRAAADLQMSDPNMPDRVAGILDMLPAGMREPTAQQAGRLQAGAEGLPSAAQTREALSGVVPRVVPQGPFERVLEGFGELAGAFPLPGAMVPAAIGGATGEAARQVLPGATGLTPETSEAIGRFVGPFAAAGVQAVRRTPGQIIAERGGRDLTPEAWAQGDDMMGQGRTAGVSLMGSEALSSPGLRRMTTDVRAHPTAGPIIEDFLAQRGPQVARAGEEMASTLGPRRDPAEIAASIQQAADEVLARAVNARSNAVGDLYETSRATPIPQPDVDYLVRLITDRARDTSEDAARELLTLAEKIQRNPRIGPVRDEVKALADAARVEGTLAATERSQAAKTAAALGAPGLRAAERTMEAVSPSYGAAQDTFRRMSPAIDALEASPIGPMSKAQGLDSLALAERALIDPKRTSPGTIRTVTRQLAQERPEAVVDFTTEYLRRTLDTALTVQQGQTPASAGSNWAKAIFGTPRQKENLTALVEEAAAAAGQNPSGVGAGLHRLMNVLERTGTVPGVGSQTAGRQEAFRIGEIITRPMSWLQNRIQRGAYEDVARALIHPDSTRILRELAVTGPNTGRERMLLTAWSNFVAGQSQE